MILTPIPPLALPRVLAAFARSLPDDAARVFARLARPTDAERASGETAERHRRAAVALAAEFGMGLLAGPPADGFSWDGGRLRVATEAYVLLHEVAHFQLAPAARRGVVDFGLGAGPETGRREEADRAQRVFGVAREAEEAAASLLGILWEAELGHPALASFLDQNWLEGAGGPAAARHFTSVLAGLRDGGFLDDRRRPTRRLRSEPDRAAA
jgi:hypothetical protein